jgi:hypothetical protein
MSQQQDNPWLSSGGGEAESHSYEELAHKLYSKAHKEWSTEITSPDAMSTLDAAVLGIIKTEFQGTGLFEDLKGWRDWKRVNWIAKDRKRAGETERIASAAAQRENERKAFREKLLGSLER